VRIRLDRFGGKLAQRLADIEAGRVTPAAPRDAATVVVLRSAGAGGGSGVEVLMLRRVAAMKFAPGAYVFPGGSVDPADSDPEIGWHGPDPAEFGARLGGPAEMARALVCAAVRETFEESGVLFAGPPGGGPLAAPSAPSGPSWEADREALAGGALSLAELLSRRGLVLRADLLVPWARWITPEGEPRRFDARFFAAALPAGQAATGHAAESDHVAWLRPADAIAAARAGEISLFPPTAATLNDFAVAGVAAEGNTAGTAGAGTAGADTAGADTAGAGGDGVAAILGRPPLIQPVMPRLAREDGQAWLYIPDEVRYPL
jgi:8-oxo-dGTP pyrophosphatase MutT (NUDIX family)